MKMAQPGKVKSARSGPTQGMRGQAVPAHGAQGVDRRQRRRIRQHLAIHQGPLVARQAECDARHRRHGATGAQQANAALADFLADAVDVLERGQAAGDFGDHRLEPVIGETRGGP